MKKSLPHRVVAILALVAAAACVESTPVAEIAQGLVTTSTDELAWASESWAGVFAYSTKINNWSPSGLGTKSVLHVTGADDRSTLLSGINADNNGGTANNNVGDVIWICNTHGFQDAGLVLLSNEDPDSRENNRIIVPGGGRTNDTVRQWGEQAERFTIDSQSCQQLIYIQPDPDNNPTKKRWLVVDGHSRHYRVTTQSLQFYPDNTPAALTSGAYYNNYDPVDTCPHQGAGSVASSGSCESGASTDFADYTVIRLQTSSTGTAYITGLEGHYDTVGGGYNGTPGGLGPVKLLINYGSGDIVLKNLNNGVSTGTYFGGTTNTAGNKFNFPSGDVTIKPYGSAWVYHSNHDSYWYAVGQPGSGTWPRVVPSVMSSSTSNTLGVDIHGSKYVIVQCSNASKCPLVGMDKGASGEEKVLCNYGTYDVVVKNNSGSGSAGETFWTYKGLDTTLPGAGGCAHFWYDGTRTTQNGWIQTTTGN